MAIFRKSTIFAFALFCGLSFSGTLLAQQPGGSAKAAKAGGAGDEEEIFDDKIREFGYWSGAAYGCVPAARQLEVERKVLNSFNHISRLFGTDRAFSYAAAFGYGSTIKIDAKKCPEFLSKFEKATAVQSGKGK